MHDVGFIFDVKILNEVWQSIKPGIDQDLEMRIRNTVTSSGFNHIAFAISNEIHASACER